MQSSILSLFATFIQIYSLVSLVLLARVILSWIPNLNPTNPIVNVLHRLTEPVLEPVRRAMPQLGMIDISPIVVFLGLQFLHRVLLEMAGGP